VVADRQAQTQLKRAAQAVAEQSIKLVLVERQIKVVLVERVLVLLVLVVVELITTEQVQAELLAVLEVMEFQHQLRVPQ
jgi:hypothetical protein